MLADQPTHIVVTCANRKRYEVPPQLRLGNVDQRQPENRFKTWTTRLSQSDHPRYPARDLYAGEHWQVARTLAIQAASTALWVASAGYGLIPVDAVICAYGATFSASANDAVGATKAEVADWWQRLGEWSGPTPDQPRTFADLARTNPEATIVAVLSEAYQRACGDDLLAAAAVLAPDALSIIGPPGVDPQLADLVVPVVANMRHSVGGSLQALNVRVAKHLLSNGAGNRRTELRAAARATMPANPPAPRPTGQRMSDADVRTLIQTHTHTSATQLLRYVRESGRSCEQSRFGRLHAEVCQQEHRP